MAEATDKDRAACIAKLRDLKNQMNGYLAKATAMKIDWRVTVARASPDAAPQIQIEMIELL